MQEQYVRQLPLLDEQGAWLTRRFCATWRKWTRCRSRSDYGGWIRHAVAPIDRRSPADAAIANRPILIDCPDCDGGIRKVIVTTYYKAEIIQTTEDGRRFDGNEYIHEHKRRERRARWGWCRLEPVPAGQRRHPERVDFRSMFDYHQEHQADLSMRRASITSDIYGW
jgi:hypothetical protein